MKAKLHTLIGNTLEMAISLHSLVGGPSINPVTFYRFSDPSSPSSVLFIYLTCKPHFNCIPIPLPLFKEMNEPSWNLSCRRKKGASYQNTDLCECEVDLVPSILSNVSSYLDTRLYCGLPSIAQGSMLISSSELLKLDTGTSLFTLAWSDFCSKTESLLATYGS